MNTTREGRGGGVLKTTKQERERNAKTKGEKQGRVGEEAPKDREEEAEIER